MTNNNRLAVYADQISSICHTPQVSLVSEGDRELQIAPNFNVADAQERELYRLATHIATHDDLLSGILLAVAHRKGQLETPAH